MHCSSPGRPNVGSPLYRGHSQPNNVYLKLLYACKERPTMPTYTLAKRLLLIHWNFKVFWAKLTLPSFQAIKQHVLRMRHLQMNALQAPLRSFSRAPNQILNRLIMLHLPAGGLAQKLDWKQFWLGIKWCVPYLFNAAYWLWLKPDQPKLFANKKKKLKGQGQG